MENKDILILASMIFCHIVDDYYLQGWLASAKQKSWWEKNASEPLYRYDYIVALFMHSFSWSFMIMIVPTIINKTWYLPLFICNIVIHMITDNAKANRKSINLIQDQLIHICQIVVTWLVYLVF